MSQCTEENINLLVEVTKRLLRFQIDLLEDMGKDPQVVARRQSQPEQTFTWEDMPKDLEVLRGELSKVENLELVLAVAGTMKAGKSTTINAIVGTEVLPSRNVPMTALPTLIRHKPGQAEPVLVLDNVGPLRKLAAKLRGNPGFGDLGEKRHFRDVIAELSSGAAIQRRYEGASNIYKCLKMVNDLVRICAELGEEFPFGEYDEVHELPVIEVEFFHLKGSNGSSGRFVLLDTPGPNESKQPHLKKMMKDQLRKASAVIAVLDYTQLKSEADAQVQDEIKALANMMTRRLYVMVNKFDERDRNSYDAEEIKRLVASDLFLDRGQGSVMKADMVFPVSAQQAFLANRALRELDLNGGLPDPDDARWVEDFGEEAFGRRWESKVQDAGEVEDSARELWKDSFFGAPLDQVIKAAHSQAAVLALDSAASKLGAYARKVSNFTKGKGPQARAARGGPTRVAVETRTAPAAECGACGRGLKDVEPSGHERRKLFDIVFETTELTVEAEIKTCPRCRAETRGAFLDDMPGPLQYGHGVVAFAMHLLAVQMVPLKRTAQSLKELTGRAVAEATLLAWLTRLYAALADWEAAAVERLLAMPVLHADVTGLRIAGENHLLHSVGAGSLTLKFVHREARTRRHRRPQRHPPLRRRPGPRPLGQLLRLQKLQARPVRRPSPARPQVRRGRPRPRLGQDAWAGSCWRPAARSARWTARPSTKAAFKAVRKRYRTILTQAKRELPAPPERIRGKERAHRQGIRDLMGLPKRARAHRQVRRPKPARGPPQPRSRSAPLRPRTRRAVHQQPRQARHPRGQGQAEGLRVLPHPQVRCRPLPSLQLSAVHGNARLQFPRRHPNRPQRQRRKHDRTAASRHSNRQSGGGRVVTMPFGNRACCCGLPPR